MRVLLFTGKGGVGKTSAAAATAVRAGAAGLRTLVVSTDPAHSLADAFGLEVGAEPTAVAPGVEAEQLDAQRRLEASWRDIQGYLVDLLQWGGVGAIEAEELSVLPGLEEIFSLIDVRRRVEDDAHDLLVVDCAPTAETLRLLSLPDALGWYMDRVFPIQGSITRVVRPVLGRMTTMPLPHDGLLDAVERLYRHLDGVRDVLGDAERTSVRLVVNPEQMVVAEARRTYAYLSLFGYNVDAVLVNRLLPDAIADPWFDRWKATQARHLAAIEASFDGVPLLRAPLFDTEVVGVEALTALGAVLYGDGDPAAVLHRGAPLRVVPCDDGWVVDLALPATSKGEVDLLTRGDELYVKVGGYTRSLVLPAALRRCEVAGAALEDGRLRITFVRAAEAVELPR